MKTDTGMRVGFAAALAERPAASIAAIVCGGIGIWVVGGLWHNLILPLISATAEAHHEGLFTSLIAYQILSFLLLYFYLESGKRNLLHGLITGIMIGITWVFPHGLVMAGIHETPIGYEISNALYHVVEQGIGGLIIALIASWKRS